MNGHRRRRGGRRRGLTPDGSPYLEPHHSHVGDRRAVWAAPVVMLLAAPLGAESDSVATIRAHRITSRIAIDGRLEEPAGSGAAPATRFTQRQPDPGAPATERTEVRIVNDGEAIYVGAHLF